MNKIRFAILFIMCCALSINAQTYALHETVFGSYTTTDNNITTNSFGSTSSHIGDYEIPIYEPFHNSYTENNYYNSVNEYSRYNNVVNVKNNGLLGGLLGGKESKYEDYCAACYAAGVRPLPIDAWSNGQWGGNSHMFQPKSPKPTGFENQYWEEHGEPDDPGLPIGNPIIPTLIFVAFRVCCKYYSKKMG